MDQTRHLLLDARGLAQRERGLAPVEQRFALTRHRTPAPPEWKAGLAELFGWLGIEPDWIDPAAFAHAPVFAPWLRSSPAAFQADGAPGLPRADFVASYAIDHVRGARPGHEAIDIVLLSPHPAACEARVDAGRVPLPRAEVLCAMLRSARSEGRERIVIVCHAAHRAPLAAMLADAWAGDAAILAVEEALPVLVSGRVPWDAIIAMPDWRSTVFTLLGQTSGVRGPWPMLWFAIADTDGAALRLVVSETLDAADAALPLDASALIHALALTLHEAGAGRAALRLHDAWARLRDSGVCTSGRGPDELPYAKAVADSIFLSMLCQDVAVSNRPQRGWIALQNEKYAKVGSQTPRLRVVR